MTDPNRKPTRSSSDDQRIPSQSLLRSEDWWSVWLGFILIIAVILEIIPSIPKLGTWTVNPLNALAGPALRSELLLVVGMGTLSAVSMKVMGRSVTNYLNGFVVVVAIAWFAKLVGRQDTLKAFGLGYALWALLFGLLISNTFGTPRWLMAGVRSELFIKIGLVLLGAEILAPKIIELGAPGLLVAWLVTPVVIIFMWLFGTRILRLPSRALVIVIACSTSVCGVSAAIAAAAACRAKKEELSLAVGMTMVFTVAMMVGLPAICSALQINEHVAGAWIGGTVDSTGAVVAAGTMLGSEAEKVAAVVKMIQNILIGLVAFLIALYWVSVVERGSGSARPSAIEIWHRFPKFVVGFVLASLLFSFVLLPTIGESEVNAIVKVTKGLRGWWFALAFVGIGLESNFRKLAAQMVGGKPIWLYLTGQTFNIILTLIAAYLAFGGILFDPVGG